MLYINEKKWSVYELLNSCPLGNSLNTCPLRDLRKSKLIDNYKYAIQLHEDVITRMIQLHKKCLNIRENE